MPTQTGTLKAGYQLVIDIANGDASATFDYSVSGATVRDNGKAWKSDRVVGPFAEDVNFTVTYTGSPSIYKVQPNGQREYTAETLPDPATLAPGATVVVDGVQIESSGNRWRRATKPGKLHLIGGRNVFADLKIAIGAEARCYQMWRPFDAKVKMRNIRILTANTWMDGSDKGVGNAFTVEASIYRPGTTQVFQTRFNNATSVLVGEQTYALSDPMPLVLDPDTDGVNGLYLRIRVRTTNTTDQVPFCDQKVIHTQGGTDCYRLTGTAAATSDFTTNLAFSTAGALTDINEFGPIFIIGETETGEIVPAAGVWGSSSATGYGDDQSRAENTQKVLGYLAHALTREKIPYIVFAQGGVTVKWDGISESFVRKQIASLLNLTHGINTYGSNDVTAGDTPSTILGNLKSFDQMIKGMGMSYTAFCTYTPVVTAADGYTTVSGQTVTNPGKRLELSQAVRDNAALWKVIDLEAISDSNLAAGLTTPSEKWAIEYGTPFSYDGQHASALVHQAISNRLSFADWIKF